MDASPLIATAGRHLDRLCNTHAHRQVGSAGNVAANTYFADFVQKQGFAVESPAFDCLAWESGEKSLTVDGESFDFHISDYSLGCDVHAPLVVVSNLSELEAVDARGKVLLVKDELAAEQLMPKNFTFFNPESHQRIIALFEQKAPAAILGATGRNPGLAGALYPFPLIEDGDFDIPAGYLKDVDGERLAAHAGEAVLLRMNARRCPARGTQVIARKGAAERRLVFSAHIDSKATTPGALDNAAGVVVLLLLAEMLRDYRGSLGIELLPFNGEDHYSVAGQKRYLAHPDTHLDQVYLDINLDGLGWIGSPTAYSFYECPDALAGRVRDVLSGSPDLVEGPCWPQGDHMIFAMHGVPAMAITTAKFEELEADIAHTEKDRPELVDLQKLVSTAERLHALIGRLDNA